MAEEYWMVRCTLDNVRVNCRDDMHACNITDCAWREVNKFWAEELIHGLGKAVSSKGAGEKCLKQSVCAWVMKKMRRMLHTFMHLASIWHVVYSQ